MTQRNESNHLRPTQALDSLHPSMTILRTDTVFPKLPFHNLVKGGLIRIEITKQDHHGVQTLYWQVSPSSTHGPPQQLAYKLDTQVINRHFDALKRPLPSIVRIGSLRQICGELGLRIGKSVTDIKLAFHQNASAYITAKLRYRDTEGKQQRFEAGFNRYSVVFTGESLPDGSSADAVYIILNESYRQVLNSAPTRPLDYDYLSKLKPLAQRFYELLSFRMYAALKYRQPHATMRYSDWCLYAPQQRHLDPRRMLKQMSYVHESHLESGYLATVETERVLDSEGQPDWLLHYTPGLKAWAEYDGSTGSRGNGRSLRGGPEEPAAFRFDASGAETPDLAAAGGYRPPPPAETHATPYEPNPVSVGDSPEPSATGPHPVSSAPLTRPVSERMTVDESPTPDPESTPSAADLVQQFHREFHGVIDKIPDAKELSHATQLITDHGSEFGTFFVQYACEQARESRFEPNFFGGLMGYQGTAIAAYNEQQSRQQHHQAIAVCRLCNQNGFIEFENGETRASFTVRCPHDEDAIKRYEVSKGCQRI